MPAQVREGEGEEGGGGRGGRGKREEGEEGGGADMQVLLSW